MSEEQKPPLTPEERAALQRKAAEKIRAALEAERQPRPASDPVEIAHVLRVFQELIVKDSGKTIGELLAMSGDGGEPPNPLGPMELRRLKSAGVPPLHRDNILPPKECEALTAVRDLLVSERDHILVLAGGLGTYKTGSACWLLSQRWGVFAKAKPLLKLQIEKPDEYERLARARYVVFDDLGTEVQDQGGHYLAAFSDLLDDWYGSKAKVVITANLTAEQFKARYGERVVDRIRERGSFVYVTGESMRGQP